MRLWLRLDNYVYKNKKMLYIWFASIYFYIFALKGGNVEIFSLTQAYPFLPSNELLKLDQYPVLFYYDDILTSSS